MDIPYTVENRPDTGMYNGKLGMWLFLASEVMLFGALFSSYVLLRVNAVDWPKGTEVLNVPLATVNTLILIGSSLAMLKAWAALKMNDHKAYKKFAWITIAMGTAFILIKMYEYSEKFSHEHYPSTSTFYAIYFTLTGLHVLHLLIGVLVNLFHVLTSGAPPRILVGLKKVTSWIPLLRGITGGMVDGCGIWEKKPGQFTNRIEVTGLYWHFVDLVWLVMFPTLYLI